MEWVHFDLTTTIYSILDCNQHFTTAQPQGEKLRPQRGTSAYIAMPLSF